MIDSDYIPRLQQNRILNSLFKGKVIVVTGPRRVGKTTMISRMMNLQDKPFLYLNGEDYSTAEILERRTTENYRQLLNDIEILVIDEAQHVKDIGFVAKLIHDELPGKQVILSGSSSFELVQKAGEPLTGRKITYELLPLAESELWSISSPERRRDLQRKRMIWGSYPEAYLTQSASERIEYLRDLRDSYLLKDVVKFENLRSADKIASLLRLIAHQVGSEVSYHELGRQLSMSKNTVEKYLDLLSKAYVLFRLGGYSRNLRKEITKSSRWYFLDNGIMNIVQNNLDDLSIRTDTGRLWENYIIAERWKYLNAIRSLNRLYFWRTYDQQEIDLVEERGDEIAAYEMKWKFQDRIAPKAWTRSYPDASYKVISPDTFKSFVGILNPN